MMLDAIKTVGIAIVSNGVISKDDWAARVHRTLDDRELYVYRGYSTSYYASVGVLEACWSLEPAFQYKVQSLIESRKTLRFDFSSFGGFHRAEVKVIDHPERGYMSNRIKELTESFDRIPLSKHEQAAIREDAPMEHYRMNRALRRWAYDFIGEYGSFLTHDIHARII